MTGVRPMPPPTSTLKPISPASFFTSCRPMSCQAIAARSSSEPLTAILNLRGRKANSGCSVLHWRSSSQYGRGSTISSGAMPANTSEVMLRMQLPEVWMPCMSTSASKSIASAAFGSGIQLNCAFWRVVKCRKSRSSSRAMRASWRNWRLASSP